MEPPDLSGRLLERLLSVSEKKDTRIDAYITGLWGVLKETKEWSPAHEVVFQEMLHEVRTSRMISVGSLAAALLLGCFITYYAFVLVPRQKADLVGQIKDANLPVRFEPSNAGTAQLLLTYDQSDFAADQRELLQKLQLDRLGVYSGLGRDALLSFVTSDEEFTWDVTPAGREDEVIGKLRITERVGRLDRLDMYHGQPVRHNDLSEVFVRVTKVPTRWTEAEPGRPVDYEVQYGVEVGEDVVWADPISIRSSVEGTLFRGPFPVFHPKWDHLYFAVIAAGHWGVEPSGEQRTVVYFFKSTVRELRFN